MKRSESIARDFQIFWNLYGNKRDRIAAERVWTRMSAKDRRAAYDGVTAYREDCRRRGVSMMQAQNYLTHRRWEDELSDETHQSEEPPVEEKPATLTEMELW